MKNRLKTSAGLWIYFVCLFIAGCKPKTGIHIIGDLLTYQDTKLTFSGINANDYFFKTSDNAQLLYQMNDTFTITALDTNEINITAREKKGNKTFDFVVRAGENLKSKRERNLNDLIFSSKIELYQIINKPFINFTLTDADGNAFSLKDILGKTTMIDCWEYGCVACMEEIKQLNKMKTEVDTAIRLVSFYNQEISTDNSSNYVFESPEMKIYDNGKITSGKKGFKIKFDFNHIKNTAAYMKKIGVFIYPTKFFIDKKGIVRYIYCGGAENIAFFKNKLEEIEAIY